MIRFIVVAVLSFAISGSAIAEVRLLPAKVTLTGAKARHRVLVEAVTGKNLTGSVDGDIQYASDDLQVVRFENGTLIPVGNGTAIVRATSPLGTAMAQVTVKDVGQPFEWTFRNHIQPIFARSSCNSGACHGALAGKGGFKLSLRGYDTDRDHHTITRQARGRRIETADPGRSLILAKPTGAIPHKGGVRFKTDSTDYRVLSEWIAAGAKPPTDKDARLDRLVLLPGRTVLKPGDKQQLLLQAYYSDGRVEDVTHWGKFTSANEAVATVDDDGMVSVIGYGEGAVSAWFSSRIVIARVTVPYTNSVPAEVYASAKRANFIDDMVLQQLQRLNLPPSKPATDAEFLRRAYIDTIGTLPTIEETKAYLDDASADKRDKLIDELLSRSEFVDFWSYQWSDLFLINGNLLRPEAVAAYYKWVRSNVEANTPWDKFVDELVTAKGSSHENGATNFYALHQDPETMAENVSQAFLGLSIACAKCHNHPLEKWTNDQYYAFANLFSRVRAKGWGGDPRNGNGLRTVYVSTTGELIQPLSGKAQPPTPLDGESVAFDATEDRRIHLAKWLTSADNEFFARSITNRVWANYFGVGLVESVDDMRASNPASNEELLAATSQYLVDNKFDLKRLMKTILQSQTYQQSSKPSDGNQDEKRFYARYYPRRMMAEVLLDAISQVTEVPSSFTEIVFPGADKKKTDIYKKGTRAIQLYDSAVGSYFLKTFGRNQRRITCECERSDEPSMVQVLHISNGDTINKKLQAKGNRIDKLIEAKASDEQIVETVFLAALNRYPTKTEARQTVELLATAKDDEKRVFIEDLFWGVISSREFIFNH